MARSISKGQDTNRISRNLRVKTPEAKPRRCQEVGVSASDEVPWQMKAAKLNCKRKWKTLSQSPSQAESVKQCEREWKRERWRANEMGESKSAMIGCQRWRSASASGSVDVTLARLSASASGKAQGECPRRRASGEAQSRTHETTLN